jgi:glycosyltransferase involved in cell wall biosynthesis
MNPENILFVHPSNELYGIDRVLLRQVRMLDRNTFCPHVAVANDLPYEGLLTNELARNEIPFRELKLGVLRRRYANIGGLGLYAYRTLASAIQLAAYSRRHNVRLVHTNSVSVSAGGIAARLAAIPHVWHVHEIITHPGWLNRMITINLRLFADTIVAVSSAVRDHLLEGDPKLGNKCIVIHNGIDPGRFLAVEQSSTQALRQSWGLRSNTIVIGMVGRISAWKGQEFLLQAVNRVFHQETNLSVRLVGGIVPGEAWREEALQQMIIDLGLQEVAAIDDFRQDIPVVLSAFDIFVLPSTLPDPFPTVVLEAMASGKPVVATAHGGALEQVTDGETGFLVSPADPNEMAQALIRLIGNRDRRLSMGAAGHARFLSHFTTNHYIRAVEDLYRNILSE